MNSPPLVSVLIPAYRAGRWIRAAIDSALAQRHPAVEVGGRVHDLPIAIDPFDGEGLVERQFGHDPLQPSVLPLKLLEPLRLFDLETAVFVAPAVVALLGELGLFARLANSPALRHEHIDLPQLRDDLFSTMSLPRHLQVPFPN